MSNIPDTKSELDGFIRYDLDAFNQTEPLDTSTVREGIVSNLEALYEGHFQVRVNDLSSKPRTFIRPDGPPATAGYLIDTYGPFPLSMLKNGDAAPLHIQACCATDAGDGTDKGTVEIWLRRAESTGGRVPAFEYYNPIGSIALSGTVVQWHTLTTPSSGLLSIPRSDAELSQPWSTRITGSDSSPNVKPGVVDCIINVIFKVDSASDADGLKWQGLIARESPWYEV